MLIAVRGLTKTYDNDRGLKPTSFSVAEGEFVGIVGHNGAGKSTLLKMLGNWIRPDAGEVVVGGVSVLDRLAVVRQIGFVPETPNLFEQFSVDHNLRLFAQMFGLPTSRVTEVVEDFGLEPFRKTKVIALSKGLKQRVSLSRCLLADPPVLLFDEPTSGLDFEMTKEVYHRLKAVHGNGKTILFTSHRPEELRMFATRIIVLHGGGIVFDGGPQDYFASKAHEDLYL